MSNERSIEALLSPSTTWAEFTLYGESIPHLLHWDFAYLWILRRDQNTRPVGWLPKVEAWRRLLCMLLLNELELDRRAIAQPLLTFTQPRGFSHVTFVRAPRSSFGQKAIGVISPTVIVRPLPEPNRGSVIAEQLAETLPAFYQSSDQVPDRRQQLQQALEHTRQSLRQSGSLLAQLLEPIISEQIQVAVQPSPSIFPVMELSQPIPLLYSADSAAWDNPRMVDLRLMVAHGTRAYRLEYVPKCSHCGKTLTFPEAAPPIDVSDGISILCSHCGAVSLFALEDFGIFREGQRIYAWRDLHEFTEVGAVAVPPSPRIVDNEVRFQWNPGMVAGDPVRTHLRLRFPQATVVSVSPREIKYSHLLVPGLREKFSGHPVRPEWLFAVEQLPASEISPDLVKFRNMRVRGLRFPVSIPPYPRAACKIVPDLQVGLYPQPLYPSWRRYRIFTSNNSAANDYQVRALSSSSAAITDSGSNNVLEWNDVLPSAVSVEEFAGDQHSTGGATWQLSPPSTPTATQPIYIGVDFGTTTSIVYVDKQGARQEALTTSDIVATAHLLGGTGPARAGFLPKRFDGDVNPSFFPSALWFATGDAFNPIRWNESQPSAEHHAVHGFKWGVEHELHRRRYIEELLFLTLPAALRKAFPHGPTAPSWKIGFAFPLAFSDPQREEYLRIFNDLRTDIQGYAGGNPAIYTINESFACVRAFGQHLFGDVFLIADLGGGSLDVALFELVQGDHGQSALNEFHVGSAKIGGEAFVEALARRIGVDPQGREREYWNIRDAIVTHATTRLYGGSENDFADLATRFVPVAQELMRVMAAAFSRTHPDKQVQFVLVGNGWRVAEYNTGVPLSASAARKALEESFNLFGIASLHPYGGPLESDPKHLVAIGALQNAKPGGRNELEEASQQAKMPAGRDVKVSGGHVALSWSDLVGPAIQNMPPGAATSSLEIDRHSGPEASPRWRDRIEHALPNLNRDPSDAIIRSRMNIVGFGLDKGPLQVMLEKRVEDLS
jgi:hypothetical protein